MNDILIKNGFIVDGSGKKGYEATIGIKDNIIEYIEKRPNQLKGNFVIDAKEKVVCPGFIDMHSHADLALLKDPSCKDKIQQGITTQVIGNCGQSVAPLREKTAQSYREYVTPILGDIIGDWEWKSFGEYLSLIQKKGVTTNIVSLIGNLAIRVAVMGFENRNPISEELEKMKSLVVEAMEAGAFGLSTGLTYPPSCYATTGELIELCEVVSQYGGIYASHLRLSNTVLRASVQKAVKEAIDIGENVGIPVQISHLQISDRIEGDTFQLMEKARGRGVDVTHDLYPYYHVGSGLVAAILPPFLIYKGNIDETIGYLSNKNIRKKIEVELENLEINWEGVIVVSSLSDKNRHLEGKSIRTIALLKDRSPVDVLIDLLIEERMSVVGFFFGKRDEDWYEIVKCPGAMFGTDGLYNSGKQHPRSWGTFPRILRKCVREKRILSLEEAIKKMTYLPAKKLGLRNRGRIDIGMIADLVIFDPITIEDKASFEYSYPCKGIEYVIINGQIVLNKSNFENVLPGKVLKKG